MTAEMPALLAGTPVIPFHSAEKTEHTSLPKQHCEQTEGLRLVVPITAFYRATASPKYHCPLFHQKLSSFIENFLSSLIFC